MFPEDTHSGNFVDGRRTLACRHQSNGDWESDKYRIQLDINSKEIQSLMELICTLKLSFHLSLSCISFSRKLFRIWTIYYGFVQCHIHWPSIGISLSPVGVLWDPHFPPSWLWVYAHQLYTDWQFLCQETPSTDGLFLSGSAPVVWHRYEPTYPFILGNVGHSLTWG